MIAAVLGTVVGAGTVILGWLLQRFDTSRARRKELRELIVSILDIREDMEARIANIEGHTARFNADLRANAKRLMFLEAAHAVATARGAEVATNEYITLAWEFWRNSDFARARRYLERALDVAATPYEQSTAYRNLGAYYISVGPEQNVEYGRELYDTAFVELAEASDPYSTYLRGYVYETWAQSEFSIGNVADGQARATRALTLYRTLPDFYGHKQVSLTRLATLLGSNNVSLLDLVANADESPGDVPEGGGRLTSRSS